MVGPGILCFSRFHLAFVSAHQAARDCRGAGKCLNQSKRRIPRSEGDPYVICCGPYVITRRAPSGTAWSARSPIIARRADVGDVQTRSDRLITGIHRRPCVVTVSLASAFRWRPRTDSRGCNTAVDSDALRAKFAGGCLLDQLTTRRKRVCLSLARLAHWRCRIGTGRGTGWPLYALGCPVTMSRFLARHRRWLVVHSNSGENPDLFGPARGRQLRRCHRIRGETSSTHVGDARAGTVLRA